MKWTDVLKYVALTVAIVLGFLFWTRGEAAVPTMTLDWTAPGDDGNVGTATTYQIRYGTSRPDTTGSAAAGPAGTALMNSWWASALPLPGILPAPLVAGSAQSVTVATGLNWNTTYYFILKTCDEVPNCSGYSNLASKTFGPPPDETPPASVYDLRVR